MTTSAHYDRPDYDRPFIDYHSYRVVAGRMRAEAVNDTISKGVSAVPPHGAELRPCRPGRNRSVLGCDAEGPAQDSGR